MVDEISALQNYSLINWKVLSARSRQRMLRNLLAEALQDRTFADLEIPTTLMAVDMVHGSEVALSKGSLLRATLATCAVPALFPPVNIDGMQVADGGVIDSLATHIAFEQRAERVVAVDVEPPLEEDNPWVDPVSAIIGSQLPLPIGASTSSGKPSTLSAMWRAFRVMSWHIHVERLEAHPPDVLLRPDVGHHASLDFKDLQAPLLAGMAEAEEQLSKLKAVALTPKAQH
jgi:NTE family protein